LRERGNRLDGMPFCLTEYPARHTMNLDSIVLIGDTEALFQDQG
jgi:hypothetical protein